MSDKVFFDTNILVYAFDQNDHARHPRARHLVESSIENGTAVFSFQVLQEFYVVTTRKGRTPLPPLDARKIMSDLTRHSVFEPTTAHLLHAIDLSIRRQLSYWDALIVVCAAIAGCGVLYTEDLSHNATLEGVRIVNPFR